MYLQVGDMVSVIDKPDPHESTWWRGKKKFEVSHSFFRHLILLICLLTQLFQTCLTITVGAVDTLLTLYPATVKVLFVKKD